MSTGSSSSMNSKRMISKSSMGINGIRFNTKRRNGKRAIKKLKDMLPAREVSVPLMIPMT